MSILAKQTMQPTNNAGLLAMIELMANPEKFRERLQHLEELEHRCDEKIALAGDADEILSLLEQSKKDRILAADTLAIAQTDAQRIMDLAREEAEKLRREQKLQCTKMLETTREEQAKHCEMARDELATLTVQMDEVRRKCAEAKERIKMEEEALVQRETQLAQAEVLLDEKRAELARQDFNVAIAQGAANDKEAHFQRLIAEMQQLAQRFATEISRVV